MNIPVIALCDTHNNLKFVDVAIPCNNNSTESISMVFWMLAREIKVLKGELEQSDDDWKDVMVDLFYHKNVEDLKKTAYGTTPVTRSGQLHHSSLQKVQAT